MDHMTVAKLRHRAKAHGLKGISRMRKAELITALESIRHQVGDRVTRYIDGKPGTIVGIQESTFDGVFDSTVQVAYDGEKFEETGTAGAHHSMIFVSRPEAPRKMADRYADGFEFDGRDDVYSHASAASCSALRLAITWLCAEAQAPIWLPRGRLAK